MEVKIAGITFKNPIIAASGTAAFGAEFDAIFGLEKLGGIALKAVTLEPRAGNPSPRVAETPAGMLNAVGLQNPGVDAFIAKELPRLASPKKTVLIANIAGTVAEDYILTAEKLNETPIDMVELNISCPNVKAGGIAFGRDPESVERITGQVKRVLKKPLIVKLTPNTSDIAANAQAAEQAGADAVSLINTITGMAIDTGNRKPILANITGGLSGPAVKPIALRMVYETAKKVSIPIIGMGGIETGEDAAAFMLVGATAVQVGTAALCDPQALPKIADELTEYCRIQNISSVTELTGGLIMV
ncbi:MAG: dihydroorotate dehydrogenase [Clostridia bacterium]|nr:dihydroorotate dehydrogenase [Clostridia bacterium]